MRSLLVSLVATAAVVAALPECNDYASCKGAVTAMAASSNPVHSRIGSALYDFMSIRDPAIQGLGAMDVNKTWCPDASYFEFMPGTMAQIRPGASDADAAATWEGICDKQVTATLSVSPSAAGTKEDPVMSVRFIAQKHDPLKILCSDVYIVATSFSYRAVDISKVDANFTAVFEQWASSEELTDVRRNGVRVLQMPCGLVGTAKSVLKTASMFDGTPDAIANHSIAFLTEKGDWSSSAPVPFGQEVHVDTSNIKSGDYMAVLRLDGLDPMIAWATGGHTGHSVVLVWEGDQLYAVESTAPDPFGASYWPCPTGCGIMRTKWELWYPRAINASYHIDLLPIKPELEKQFDEDRFWAWFKTVEGMPYGYHTMLYSFLDTADPMQNMPAPIDNNVMTWVLNLLEDVIPDTPGNPVTVQSIFVEALNVRLNTSCTSMRCIEGKLVATDMSLSEATAIPEMDNTWYNGNYSMVCSEFAARVWLTGLGDAIPTFQGAEQTPKDNYQSAMFDPDRFNAQNCPGGLRTSPKGTYCQLMGEYVMELNDYNSIPLYANMNNHCPSQWPYYFRCPASNPQCC